VLEEGFILDFIKLLDRGKYYNKKLSKIVRECRLEFAEEKMLERNIFCRSRYSHSKFWHKIKDICVEKKGEFKGI